MPECRPRGLSINSGTGLVSGTPKTDQVGAHEVAVQVTDVVGTVTDETALRSWRLEVVALNGSTLIPNAVARDVVKNAVTDYAEVGSFCRYDVEAAYDDLLNELNVPSSMIPLATRDEDFFLIDLTAEECPVTLWRQVEGDYAFAKEFRVGLRRFAPTASAFLTQFVDPDQVFPWRRMIMDDEVAALVAWLHAGGDVNQENAFFLTPFGAAIMRGRLEMVQLMMPFKPDVRDGIELAKNCDQRAIQMFLRNYKG